MFYTFVKDSSGNVQRVGAECSVPPEFVEKLTQYTNDGCVAAEAEEWDKQVIGTHAGMVPSPELPTSKTYEEAQAEQAQEAQSEEAASSTEQTA